MMVHCYPGRGHPAATSCARDRWNFAQFFAVEVSNLARWTSYVRDSDEVLVDASLEQHNKTLQFWRSRKLARKAYLIQGISGGYRNCPNAQVRIFPVDLHSY